MYIAPKPSGDAGKPENQFQFQVVEGGTEYTVPKLAFVKPSIVADMTGTKQEQAHSMFLLFREYAPGALDEIQDNQQLGGIYTAWVAASGIELGESSGSGVSSSSTAEPSTETSSSSGAHSMTSAQNVSPGLTSANS